MQLTEIINLDSGWNELTQTGLAKFHKYRENVTSYLDCRYNNQKSVEPSRALNRDALKTLKIIFLQYLSRLNRRYNTIKTVTESGKQKNMANLLDHDY